MGILGRAARAFIPPYAAYRGYRAERQAGERIDRKNQDAIRRANEKDKKNYKAWVKKQENPYRLSKKELKKFYKAQYKGVREAMKPHEVKMKNLTPRQEAVQDKLANRAAYDIDALKNIGRIKKPSETEEFRAGKQSLLDILSGSPAAMEKYQAPLIRQYKGKIIPAISEQFATQFGGHRSTAFQNALTEAANQLSLQLGEQRAQLQDSARHQALSYAQMPITEEQNLRNMALNEANSALSSQKYNRAYYPPQLPGAPPVAPFRAQPQPQLQQAQPGFYHQLLGQFAGPAAQAAGYAAGGPAGGAIGGALGNAFGNAAGGYKQPVAANPALPMRQVQIENVPLR